MPLVEVIRGPATEAELVDDLIALVRRAGKVPIVVQSDVAGFLINRLQYALAREAYRLVEDGVATPENVDRAVTLALAVRWSAVGPLLATDLAGPDVVETVCARLFPSLAAQTGPLRCSPRWWPRVRSV
jgi:3-hydroxybutyryl-CoA dehydrogenase